MAKIKITSKPVRELKKDDVFSFNRNSARYKVWSTSSHSIVYVGIDSKRNYGKKWTEMKLKVFIWKRNRY